MTSGDAISAFVYFAPWAIVIGGFVGRNWIKAELEKGIQHRFDQRLEKLRGELRKSEEHLKAELRKKENQITLLRSTVLTGSAARQSLLDKRRFEAVEKIWTAINDMAHLKALSASMAVLNFDNIAKRVSDPKIQKFLDFIGINASDIETQTKNVARDERPFLPELAWAYFEAYLSILFANYARFKVLKIGIDDPGQYLTAEPLKRILKAALPHHSEWIEQHDPGAYHGLLDEIQELLLGELRKILDGTDADKAAAGKAKQILAGIEDAHQERILSAAEAAGIDRIAEAAPK